MNDHRTHLLKLCLEDSLFAALYEALRNLESRWQTPSPQDMWARALQARSELAGCPRPDLLVRQLFAGQERHEALVAEAILMWMLFNEDRRGERSPLKDALAGMLCSYGKEWQDVYQEFRESEGRNEQAGFRVSQADYAHHAPPAVAQERLQDGTLAHEMVSDALESHNLQLCQALLLILSRIDYQNGHIYEDEVTRLIAGTDKMQRASHEPQSVNYYARDSCRFEAGSTQNGNVSLES